jgi:hypothetical protein
MTCRLAACSTLTPHGHYLAVESCLDCIVYALEHPELVGEPTPHRPWHHASCGRHSEEFGAWSCDQCKSIEARNVAAEAEEERLEHERNRESFVSLHLEAMKRNPEQALADLFDWHVKEVQEMHCEYCDC